MENSTGSTPPGTAGRRRAAFAFIFVTVVLDVLALGIIIPVLPKLVERFAGGDTASAARWYGILGTVWAAMQFLCSPLLGALSDRFGRRSVILVSCFGLGFDYLLTAMAPSLGWLFVARALSGMTAASFSTAAAYVADVTPPEQRAARFGVLGAGFGLGFVLGPALGGVLGSIEPRLPFWAAGALCIGNALYGLFVLPESLPPERRGPFSWARANPLGSLRLLRSQRELAGLALVLLLYHLAHHTLPSTWVLYVGYRYGWGERTAGLMLAAVGVGSIAVQGGLVRVAVARLGERACVLAGLACGALGFLIYGSAPTGALHAAGVPVFALIGLCNPAVQALMTRRVGVAEQGQLQGASSSIMGLTGLVGPILFTQAFSLGIAAGPGRGLPGASFFLAAGLLLAGMAVAARVTSVIRRA